MSGIWCFTEEDVYTWGVTCNGATSFRRKTAGHDTVVDGPDIRVATCHSLSERLPQQTSPAAPAVERELWGIPQYFGPDYSFCHPLKLKFILHASEGELSKVFRTGFGFSLWWPKLKLLTLKVEFVGKIVSITGHHILLIFLKFQICCLNIKVEMSPNRSFLHSPYLSFWHFWKKMCSLAWFLLLLSRDGQSDI